MVLDNVNLSLEVGEFMGILGPAGAGKSTLLNILSTLEKPDGGKFKLLGVEPRGRERSVLRRMGIWLSEDVLIPPFTVWQNLWFSSLFLGIPFHLRRRRISKYLNAAGIWELRGRTVSSLSLKEKGLVNAVRVILNEPSLLLLDEPESKLDAEGMDFFWQQISHLRAEHNTAILWASTRGEWFEGADRVAIMKRGRIIACDTPLHLKRTISGKLPELQTAFPQSVTLEEVFLSLIGGGNG